MQTKIIGFCPGSEDGVGPELLIKALLDARLREHNYFWCGDRVSLELACERAQQKISFKNSYAHINNIIINYVTESPHSLSFSTLKRQAWFLQQAADLAEHKQIQALVTGPIHKAALQYLDSGFLPGQTEYFAKKLGHASEFPLMVFMGGPCIMSLVTTHVPINQVAGLITQEKLENHIRKIAYYSETLLSKKLHNIIFHVLALNPHAGEAGLLGCEEQEVIIPVLNSLRKNNLNLKGPFSPDGYFAYFNNLEVKPDILIAMYHDQGLIPYKLLSSGNAVNVTLGLRIPRTSPAHGTADDLVGKNIASPLSTINAVITAAKLISG